MRSVLAFVGILIVGCFGGDDFFDENVHMAKWVKCQPNEVFVNAPNLNKTWYEEKYKLGWYYVMSNKWHIVSITKSLTGKPPMSKDSIKNACLAMQKRDSGFVVCGYGNKAAYKCAKEENGVRSECVPTKESTNETWATARGTTEAAIIWTDNQKYILGVRCAGLAKTWSLRSTDNVPVDEATKKTVLKFIVDNGGFKAENAVDIPRAGCPDLPKPA